MDNEVFDNVKFEKEKAMARYNRFQNMMKMLQIFEVVVVIMVISWSWTRIPVAVKISGDFFVQVCRFMFKPHVVFLIGNGIIVAIVVLCRQTDGGNNNSSEVDDEGEICEIQQPIVTDLPVSSLAPPLETPAPTAVVAPSVTISEDNQIVSFSTECKVPVTQQRNDVATVIDTATKQIQKFKRTQSEKLKREIASTPRRELRRSETDPRRESNAQVEEVDTLSNEEFRLTIEAFIKKNQIFFEKQRRAETEPEKYEPIGIEAF